MRCKTVRKYYSWKKSCKWLMSKICENQDVMWVRDMKEEILRKVQLAEVWLIQNSYKL